MEFSRAWKSFHWVTYKPVLENAVFFVIVVFSLNHAVLTWLKVLSWKLLIRVYSGPIIQVNSYLTDFPCKIEQIIFNWQLISHIGWLDGKIETFWFYNLVLIFCSFSKSIVRMKINNFSFFIFSKYWWLVFQHPHCIKSLSNTHQKWEIK